jgi:hypothetical protein
MADSSITPKGYTKPARHGIPARKIARPDSLIAGRALRAEEQLAAAEVTLGAATSIEAREQAQADKTKAIDRIAQLQTQWAAAKADLQPKFDAVTAARQAALAACRT